MVALGARLTDGEDDDRQQNTRSGQEHDRREAIGDERDPDRCVPVAGLRGHDVVLVDDDQDRQRDPGDGGEHRQADRALHEA